MKHIPIMLSALCAISSPLLAAEVAAPTTPSAVVDSAPKGDWVSIAPRDLLVMDLAPDAAGKSRRVVIQLMGGLLSAKWVENIRVLALAHWWDGLAIVRVQDNYVVQWGDPGGEDPKLAKALPPGLQVTVEADYITPVSGKTAPSIDIPASADWPADAYVREMGGTTGFSHGFPVAYLPPKQGKGGEVWPIHCYGSLGVGRGLSPDTGSGAELYTVIGQAPRQLDRNIAVVGRVIDGIENLTVLPRGTGELGFYETPQEHTRIAAIRLGSEVSGLPAYEYLSTSSASFARYVHLRANRKDDFYIRPAGGVDVCNVPVPVRRVK